MAAQQETVRVRMLAERTGHAFGERRHVLGILENRQPLAMLVRLYAGESFQHLVALDRQAAAFSMKVGKHRAPDRVSVEHRAGASLIDHANVQQAFVGRPGVVFTNHARLFINHKNVFSGQRALVDAAGRHRQTQGIAFNDRAQVSTCAEHPATLVEPGRGRHQSVSNLCKTLRQGPQILSRRVESLSTEFRSTFQMLR